MDYGLLGIIIEFMKRDWFVTSVALLLMLGSIFVAIALAMTRIRRVLNRRR